MELVSVVVPIYNVEKYLEECIKSLLIQTYNKIEIILVDDGSKDNSGNICDAFQSIDDRIVVIHKQNEGLGYARNSGLKIAKGSYVTFIDSDDIAESDLIENLIKGIKKNNSDTCIGGYKRINKDGDIIFNEKYEEAIYLDNDVYNKLFIKMLGSSPERHDSIRMSVWNVMYSMKIIKQNGLMFPSERDFISEDLLWDLEYYKYSKSVAVIDSSSYLYRITPGSLTQKYKKDKFNMICKLYVEVESRLNNSNLNNEAVIRLQKQFFINLRSCISQEAISNKDLINIYKAIKEMLENKIVINIINTYPIRKLNIGPRIFLYFIKIKSYFLISILSKCKLL